MRKTLVVALFFVVPLVFAACVGDDSSPASGSNGADSPSGTPPPGTHPPPGDDSHDAANDTNPPPGDGGGDGDAAAPKCGYAGEACCGGGLAPCNPGTVCTSSVCVANDVILV